MIQLVYSPQWFYGKDIVIDIVAIFVLMLIAVFALRFYKIDKTNKKYLYIALSFILISLAFLFKIMTNFTIYYLVEEIKRIGLITIMYHEFEPTNILFLVGFFAYRIFTLLGLYFLYLLYQEKQQKQTIFLIIYLLFISTYFTQQAYYIFHLTSLILLTLIVVQYFKNYKKKKHSATKSLGYSFTIIALSQVISMFVALNGIVYVIAEIIQLVGYIALLFTFIKVLRHGKKKR